MTKATRSAFALVAFLLSVASATERGSAAAPAGTKITNQATASFQDVGGASYSSVSNTVAITVSSVSSLAFGPMDTSCPLPADSVTTSSTFTRTFTITNTSNVPDSYTLSSLAATAGSITSSVFSANGSTQPASVGGSPSGNVAPGQTILLVVTLNDAGVPPATKIFVTASVRTTVAGANGTTMMSAEQCAVTQSPPVLVGVGGAGTVISKTVNGVASVQSQNGDTVQFDIVFKNVGGSSSLQTIVDDPVPAGLTPVVSSLVVNNVASPSLGTLVGQDLKVAIGTVAAGATVDVAFKATVSSQSVGSSFVNTASVLAQGLPAQSTLPASVLVGTGNVVYDGTVGPTEPITGAVVQFTDQSGTTPVPLSGTSVGVNPNNTNPMTTVAGGMYGFGFYPPKGGGTYVLLVSAPGYAPRRIQVVLTPDPTGTLYTVVLTSLDGEPLAVSGGFSLTAGPVTTSLVYGLLGNIPLFRPSGLTVTKTVDRNTASGGDRLVYTLTVANSSMTLGQTTVEDDLPPFVAYAPGTGRVDGEPVEPTVNRNVLIWTFPNLSVSHTITFASIVLPNVSESTTLTNHMIAKAQLPGSPGFFATGLAEAQTQIVPGIFTDRIPITGRVYIDYRNADRFLKGDVGLGGARVWLEDGESAVTDAFGRYDFPAVRPGMHVLHVDESTLPPIVQPYRTRAYNEERSLVRLVHGPFDGALLQDINFGVKPLGPAPVQVTLPVQPALPSISVGGLR